MQTKKAIIEAPQQFSIASYSQGTCKSQILKRRLKLSQQMKNDCVFGAPNKYSVSSTFECSVF